ncbi:triadin-like [Centruroides vittatus]|uniref:triadin-like n=1 Tax=Centruroides vittatus TaxID=120091 RepID=UPI00350F823B
MSVICQTFIQNSWKKDLCSNCFKTLADHRQSRDKNRYYLHTATPYHGHQYADPTEWKYVFNTDKSARSQNWSIPKVTSILKDDRHQNGRSVAFLDQDPIIIGYGGDDYHTDDDELWDVLSDDGEFNLDKFDETDEDRAISKITKENTRFNTVIKEEARSTIRYEPVYMDRRVTRIDDSYNKNSYRDNSWKYNDKQKTYNDFPKPYHLPRVSIGYQSSSSSCSNSSYQSVKQSKSEVLPLLKNSPKLDLPDKESILRSNSPDRRHQSSPASERCDSRSSTSTNDNASFVAAKLKACTDNEAKGAVKTSECPVRGSIISSSSDKEMSNNNNKDKEEDNPDRNSDKAASDTEKLPVQEKLVSETMQAESEKVEKSGELPEEKCKVEPPSSSPKSKELQPETRTKDEECNEKSVKKDSVHYAVSNALKESPTENFYAVSPILDETQRKPNRETKLAALAIELEQARHEQHKNTHSENPHADDTCTKLNRNQKHGAETEKHDECQKSKKSKFSLKKLLKRNKDTESGDSSAKSWKHGDYDKSTLRLKIVHPMDLVETLCNNTNAADTEETVANDLSHTVKQENEEKNTPAHSSKQQEIPSTTPQTSQSSSISHPANRNKTSVKSERPSKPPPPPKCNPVRPKSADLFDLTIPLKNGLPMEISTRNHQEQVYDVPKNLKNQQKNEEKRDSAVLDEDKQKLISDSLETKINGVNPVTPDISQNTWRTLNTSLESPQTNKESPNLDKMINHNDPSKKEMNKTPKAWITLEHSYAVVTAANHEVLSKFLDTAAEERSQQLWKPENCSLNWTDFELVSNQPVKVLHDILLFDAIFRHGLRTELTLMVTKKTLQPLPCGKGESTYPVLGYFVDNLPQDIASRSPLTDSVSTVHILQRSDVDTLENYCSSTNTDVDLTTEKTFILLQLVHFLKVFQGRNLKGVPEMRNIFLSKKDKEMNRVIFLNNSDLSRNHDKVSLCQFALTVAKNLFHFNSLEDISSSPYIPATHKKIFNNIFRLLQQEKSFSLMQCQGFIEYALWGPLNVVQNCKRNQQEIDITLQRWLDTERAKCLKILVRTLCTPNVVTFLISYDEFHAEFLLKTSVRSLREVALKS